MEKIVCFGAGPMFKGGLANYNTSLAKALDAKKNVEVHIVSWTQQYPSIIPRDFIDRKSKSDLLEGTNIKVHYLTNYNNPLSWRKTVKLVKKINPSKMVIQWSIAIQGLPLGRIAKLIKHKSNIEVIFDLHFVIQKENSNIDKMLTKYALSKADSFIVHSLKTGKELEQVLPQKNFYYVTKHEKSEGKSETQILKLYHPVYNMFQPDPDFDIEKQKKEWGIKKHVFLFFGFIRKYKGLHNAIKAFAKLAEKRDDVSLLVVGESFWQTLDNKKLSTRIKQFVFKVVKTVVIKKGDDEKNYRPLELIDELGIKDKVFLMNDFVPNEDVHKYFQVSDAILLFYLYATPSGVESIAYNFKLPILATSVGHFPETVKDGYNGYLAEPENIESMATAMEKIITTPISAENIEESSKEMSWSNYADAILAN
ncbi:MAG TPA: glycosyltransferase family 4 protein [Draconibacterium sp.]|nr:glycosyltransferase family 4 protein [Draconibacterium sp.]